MGLRKSGGGNMSSSSKRSKRSLAKLRSPKCMAWSWWDVLATMMSCISWCLPPSSYIGICIWAYTWPLLLCSFSETIFFHSPQSRTNEIHLFAVGTANQAGFLFPNHPTSGNCWILESAAPGMLLCLLLSEWARKNGLRLVQEFFPKNRRRWI